MMRFQLIMLFCACSFAGFCQTKGTLLDRFDTQRSGKHFVYQWRSGETTEEEIFEAEALAEEAFGKLSELLGADHMPDQKLIITFRGEGLDPVTKRKRTPHVDYQGRIHLYRFVMGGYLTPLPHELVHAIRINTLPQWERFFEEGLASALAYYLYPDRKGFPRFGYPLDVIAGYWLVSGRGIPVKTMWEQHGRLNLKCQLQTYVTREDFFYFLIRQYGVEELIAYANSAEVGNLDGYKTFYGRSFESLVTDWETDLRKRYSAYEGAEQLADEYFRKTSAQYIPVCEAGVDY